MERQCPKPKRKRDATWFRDKVLLVEAQGSGKVLNEEELVFLADPKVAEGPVTQTVITHNAAYQVDDLDAYGYDCDDFSTAKAVLIANFSSYRSNVLSEVPHSENTHNDMLNQSVQEMSYSEQTHLMNYAENAITSDSNIIPYSQYLLETQNAAVHDTNSFAQQDAMILSIRPMLYNGSVMAKETNVISIVDSEETLMLEEDSRFKMFLKQSDPMVLEKKVNIKPINYAELNRLSEDFVSIKEDTTYLCRHSPKTTKETRSNTPYPEEGNTPYSNYMGIKYSRRYQTWSHQGQGNNFNRGNNFQNNQGYRAPMNNAPNFQNQPFQAPNNQIQPGIPNELSSYMKSNESLIRNMQNQINVLRGDFNKQEENLRRNLNNDMRSILGSFFQNQASTSGTLPSNTVPNPKGEMKVVTTRSGLAYEGPSIPTNSPLEKVVERETEETTDKEQSNCQGSITHIQPSVVPAPSLEPDVPKTQPKPSIPYHSRLND
uniref:Reverse transcriptase domain-containing protein n=1 Tax=Tanacetum cinerariifolium TaxID=118510 RepID=A0A699HC55_TANCI|nr:reverse transcriptase domain-containing protein [Tanacetum cinerariifolium]